MTHHTLTERDLLSFTGTESLWRHPLVKTIAYTDGARHVANAGGAHWLLDEIVFAQTLPSVAAQPFQVWRLVVAEDRSASLTCEDGDGSVVHTQQIAWTDFPLAAVTFYLADRVILLPGEY